MATTAVRQDAVSLFKAVSPSVATLEVQKSDGTMSQGSAFMISADGYAATSWHVIEGASGVRARFSDGTEATGSGVVDYDVKADIAIIRLRVADKPFLKLASQQPEIGTSIYCIGAPQGLEFSITDGIVSQIRSWEGITLLQVSCPISPGNSGGPIVNAGGEVLGIVRSSLVGAQNLNFAVYVSHLRSLDQSLPTTPWAQLPPPQRRADPPVNEEQGPSQRALAKELLDVFAENQVLAPMFTRIQLDFQSRLIGEVRPDVELVTIADRYSQLASKLSQISFTDPRADRAGDTIAALFSRRSRFSRQLFELSKSVKRDQGWSDENSDEYDQIVSGFYGMNSEDLGILMAIVQQNLLEEDWQSYSKLARFALTQASVPDASDSMGFPKLFGSGFVFDLSRSNGWFIEVVIPGTPAFVSGLEVGDQVISVDGYSIDDKGVEPEELRLALQKDTTSLVLGVSRPNGDRADIRLSLSDAKVRPVREPTIAVMPLIIGPGANLWDSLKAKMLPVANEAFKTERVLSGFKVIDYNQVISTLNANSIRLQREEDVHVVSLQRAAEKLGARFVVCAYLIESEQAEASFDNSGSAWVRVWLYDSETRQFVVRAGFDTRTAKDWAADGSELRMRAVRRAIAAVIEPHMKDIVSR